MATVVIDVPTQKGGSCKTTTVLEVAGEAARSGMRVLIIDFDPQGSLSDLLGVEHERSATVYDVLAGYVEASDAVQRWERKGVGFDVLAANENLAYVGNLIQDDFGALKRAIADLCLVKPYDLIMIDGAPMPQTVLAFNALFASDWVLLPTRASRQYVQSLLRSAHTIEKFAAANDGKPVIEGVVLCDHSAHIASSKHWEGVATLYCRKKGIVMHDRIRHSSAVEDAQTEGLPVVLGNRGRPVARDYRRFCAELFARVGLGA